MSDAGLLRVILKRGKSKPFWLGHPWVFSGAVQKVEGDVPATGGPCIVIDDRSNTLGSGFYNPNARIAVRLHQHRRSTDLPFESQRFVDVLDERLQSALTLRAALGLGSADTDAYRCVNGAGDALPGLVVDRLGPIAVISLHGRGVYEIRDVIARRVAAGLGSDRIITLVTETASRFEAMPSGAETLPGASGKVVGTGPVEVVEGGLRYKVDPLRGQKTGFYADQRESRASFAALSHGQSVLDLYCYVGGFGLSAARAGAASVVAVDSSANAVQAANANAELNGLSEGYRAINEDAISFLKTALAQGRSWQRIVVDPPKFARGRGHLNDALKKYARLNSLAMQALTPGGLLMTCSCSEHVDPVTFARMLTESGHRLRRSVRVHRLTGLPADHPVVSVAPEGSYLTVALVSLA